MIFEIALLAIGFIVTITALVLSDGTSWVPIIVAVTRKGWEVA